MSRPSGLPRFAAAVARLLPQTADFTAMRRRPGRDLLAGITVAVVALPLALGFGVASGLGAASGLITAIIAGVLAAIFGGSNLQVSGPTGAMTVVLVPVAQRYGRDGVLTVGLLAGLILLALAFARAGRYARYVPAPVVEGFTLGIAAVIFLQQVPGALGVKAKGDSVLVVTWHAVIREPNWAAVGIAVSVASALVVAAKFWPKLPFSLLAVGLATVVTVLANLPVATIGALPATLPAPSWRFFEFTAVPGLLTSAVAVAALAALESLLCATVADGMVPRGKVPPHDPDRELFGQGVANLAVPLFGGVPATAAIARTAVNVRAGGRSRLAPVTHALVLALIMLALAPMVGHIPLAALAGVLMATAIRMVDTHALKSLTQASRSDALVLGLTAAATLALDLVAAVVLGLVVAGVMAIRAIARAARVEQMSLAAHSRDKSVAAHALVDEHIAIYRLAGPLFFAAAQEISDQITEIDDVRVAILDLSHVSTVDATGGLSLREALDRLESRDIAVYLSGLDRRHRKALIAIGLWDRLDAQGRVFPNAHRAIAAARTHVGQASVVTVS